MIIAVEEGSKLFNFVFGAQITILIFIGGLVDTAILVNCADDIKRYFRRKRK